MKGHYDPNLLQTRTCTKMLVLILDLQKQLKLLQDSINSDIAEDEESKNLSLRVKSLKKLHHNSLNSLKYFSQKTHSEQIKYMFSGCSRERYKMS